MHALPQTFSPRLVLAACVLAAGFSALRAASPPPIREEFDEYELVLNEDFEKCAVGGVPAGWHASFEESPAPQSVVRGEIGVDGSKCLELTLEEPPRPFYYLSLTKPITGLVSGNYYRLSAMVKGADAGKTETIIGVCSDRLGNENHKFLRQWTPKDEWQEVSMVFKATAANLNLVIRNERARLRGLLIDNLRVVEVQRRADAPPARP